ncbi:MAG: ChbG/HpnK family deacetylase [Chloroflexi bacterium]|nr:ChbG/HpnK family deacetylase [Chloroflexota bacterium]
MTPRASRHLIVTADDFGISRGVNRGIVEAHRGGLVTTASVMPNMLAAEDALTRAAVCPGLDLGLHLTLTAGRPLSRPNDVPSLVDLDGRFLALGRLLARLSLGQVRRIDLERELEAQVNWAERHGLIVDHLDSHHHIHIHPRVAPIVLELATRHHVSWVRCPVETPLGALPPAGTPRDLVRTLAISAFGSLLRQQVRRRGLRSAAHFRGIGMGMGFDTPKLIGTLARLPAGVTELMTHPGYPDAELARATVFSEGREQELAALTSTEARDTVRQRRIHLTSFSRTRPVAAYT